MDEPNEQILVTRAGKPVALQRLNHHSFSTAGDGITGLQPNPPMPTRTQPAETMAERTLICLLLAAAVVALYWPVARFDSINYDDGDYFVKNPQVQNGLTGSGLLWAFRTGTAYNWHPLTWVSLMFDVSFSASHSPSGPHISNVIYHAANSVLLFLLLCRLTGAHWQSALVAGLFAVHPLNVESVAWISERKNVLSTLFWLLTLLAYARYVQERNLSDTTGFPAKNHSGRYSGFALAAFACGLMCKPMLVTLPCTLLLLDCWPLNRWRMDSLPDWRKRLPRLLLEKTPFFVLAALSSAVTLLVERPAFVHYPLTGRIENAFVSYSRYWGKTFWPENLAVFYPYAGHWEVAVWAPAALFVIMATLAAWHWGRRWPFLMTGWFWFLGTLVPVIGLIQVGAQSMADRYAYVPLIGIFIIVSWGAAELFRRWRVPTAVTGVVAVFVLAASAMVTRHQLGFWQNGGTLFMHAVAVTQNNVLAYYNIGYDLDSKGKPLEAMKYYRAAIQIDPNAMNAHMNLGLDLERAGQYHEALEELTKAARIAPQDVGVHFDLGCVLVEQGYREQAIEQFKEALRLKPGLKLAELRLQELGVDTTQIHSPSVGK